MNTFRPGDCVHVHHIDACGNHYHMLGVVAGQQVPPYVHVRIIDSKGAGYSGGHYDAGSLALVVGVQLPLFEAA